MQRLRLQHAARFHFEHPDQRNRRQASIQHPIHLRLRGFGLTIERQQNCPARILVRIGFAQRLHISDTDDAAEIMGKDGELLHFCIGQAAMAGQAADKL